MMEKDRYKERYKTVIQKLKTEHTTTSKANK